MRKENNNDNQHPTKTTKQLENKSIGIALVDPHPQESNTTTANNPMVKTSKLDKFFKLTERNGSLKGEFIGGIVNFLVVSYIMVVIPSILAGSGSETLWKALFLATIICVVVSSISIGIFANLPLVYAPGIGICSYMASLISSGTYTYSQTLVIVLLGGILFLLLTIVGLRDKIVNGIPNCVKTAIPVGVGLFIANIGFSSSNSTILDFFTYGANHIGDNGLPLGITAGVALFSLALITILYCNKVKGSIFYGIVGGTILDIILKFCIGLNPFESLINANWLPPFSEFFSESFFHFDFAGLFSSGSTLVASILSVVILILSFTMIDIFDTVGTVLGACKRGNLFNEKGEIINFKQVMYVDSSSTIFGSMVGVPTCTAYVESATGIECGARTGLASIITALLFLLCIFISPLVMLIPTSATSSALIFVGILMFNGVLDIDFHNIEVAIPSFFTIALMPFTGNIAYGIAGGLISYCLVMISTKKAKQVPIITYICSLLFILYFICNGLI